MRLRFAYVLLVLAACGEGQNTGQKIALGTTSAILRQAQPSLQMESDYELASRAIPGALKTIEGFWISAPHNEDLLAILTEGYCQYATAFVEDEWEIAKFKKDLDAVEYHNTRASKMFTRCLNYALKQLPSGFEKDLFGPPEVAAKRINSIGRGDRNALMWSAVALGGLINHNLTHVEMLSFLPTVKVMLNRLVALDQGHLPSNVIYAALPHLALGMVYSGASVSFGGDPKTASEEFQKAILLTGSKEHPERRMMLPRVLWAYRVGLQTNDRKLFHDQLVKVLETDPAIWPEQRLANEVAHRRARRYLSHEKELFQ